MSLITCHQLHLERLPDEGETHRILGIDLDLPSHYPALVEARDRRAGPAVRTIQIDGSDLWAFPDSDTLRVIAPGGGARAEPGHAGWLLLRDDGAGLRVWVVRDEDVEGRPEGDPLVCADGTRMAGPGQVIYWVASREAALDLGLRPLVRLGAAAVIAVDEISVM